MFAQHGDWYAFMRATTGPLDHPVVIDKFRFFSRAKLRCFLVGKKLSKYSLHVKKKLVQSNLIKKINT